MDHGRRAAIVAIALACGCFVASPVVRFGGGKSPEQAQHQVLGELIPPQLAMEPRWTGDVRTLKIRVWADDDHRAQNVHWQRVFGEQLDYANAVLAASFGIRLDAEYRSWSHHAPGATLTDVLDELAREDPGDGVFAVVGLTSALPLVSATFDQLGVARLPGRHLVLRGYADVEERAAFARAFPKIPADERDAVHEARRRHKLTAVLLHELGHNLGADHDPDPDSIMSATYSDRSASFSARARDVILASLAGRTGRPHEQAARHHAAAPHATTTVTVTAGGDVLVGGVALDGGELGELFAVAFADDRDTELVVRTEPGAPPKAIADVLDRAKAAGLRRLTIAPLQPP